jgi:hypothetical protein
MRWSLIFRQLDVMVQQFEEADNLSMDDIVMLNVLLASRDAYLAGEIQAFANVEQ